jgi:hypothetical protein
MATWLCACSPARKTDCAVFSACSALSAEIAAWYFSADLVDRADEYAPYALLIAPKTAATEPKMLSACAPVIADDAEAAGATVCGAVISGDKAGSTLKAGVFEGV